MESQVVFNGMFGITMYRIYNVPIMYSVRYKHGFYTTIPCKLYYYFEFISSISHMGMLVNAFKTECSQVFTTLTVLKGNALVKAFKV